MPQSNNSIPQTSTKKSRVFLGFLLSMALIIALPFIGFVLIVILAVLTAGEGAGLVLQWGVVLPVVTLLFSGTSIQVLLGFVCLFVPFFVCNAILHRLLRKNPGVARGINYGYITAAVLIVLGFLWYRNSVFSEPTKLELAIAHAQETASPTACIELRREIHITEFMYCYQQASIATGDPSYCDYIPGEDSNIQEVRDRREKLITECHNLLD